VSSQIAYNFINLNLKEINKEVENAKEKPGKKNNFKPNYGEIENNYLRKGLTKHIADDNLPYRKLK